MYADGYDARFRSGLDESCNDPGVGRVYGEASCGEELFQHYNRPDGMASPRNHLGDYICCIRPTESLQGRECGKRLLVSDAPIYYRSKLCTDIYFQRRDLVHDLTMILLNLVPSITARRGIRGRKKVAAAFLKYFNADGQKQGSKFVQNRYDVSIRNGVSVEDTAEFEVGGGIAILVNTTPTVFWMLFYVYSCPEVLQDLRRELAAIMRVTKDASGSPVRTLDIVSVKTHCPLLTSTFQEVLRHRSVSTSVRQVMEDTMLDGKYLLKKDAILQMPSLVIHTDAEIWGSDVESFNHRRFMTNKANKPPETKRVAAGAFRAFGGGSTLCPGRHFATTEILAVVVGFVMRYELTPEAGRWSPPTHAKTNIAAAIMEPDYDLSVKVEPRAGFEDGSWAFELPDSEMVFAAAAEDLKL